MESRWPTHHLVFDTMADLTVVRLLERRNERIDAHIRKLLGTVPASQLTNRVVDLAFVLGSSGTELAVGDHAFVRVGLDGPAHVMSWSLAATVGGTPTSSSVVVDVLVGATLATAASICGTAEPELTSDVELNDQPPTGWSSVVIPDPSWVKAVVESADGTVEVVGLTLRLQVE